MGHATESALRLVTYCGLYCGLCAQRARVPRIARQLQQTLHEEGFDDFYQYLPDMKETFPTFWTFLEKLASFECSCRTGKGGPPDCKIRNCATERRILLCPLCTEYPCKDIERLAERYPTLLQDGRRLRRIGVTKWVDEQEARARRGFTYADVRFSP